MDGIALLQLGPLDDPEALHANLERFGAETYRMSLFVPMAELAANHEKVLRFLHGQLGEVLELHTDNRGVFVYGEGAYQAATYAELIAEVGDNGFWARPPEPELSDIDELPPEERGQVLQDLAQQAMAAILGAQGGRAPMADDVPARRPKTDPAPPAAEGERTVHDDLAERYDAVADELRRAAAHLDATARYFRERKVPRASAHRHAADGHLIGSKLELDALAVIHAGKARLPDE